MVLQLQNDGDGNCLVDCALVSLPLVTTQRSSKSSGAEASTFAVEIVSPKSWLSSGRHLSDAIRAFPPVHRISYSKKNREKVSFVPPTGKLFLPKIGKSLFFSLFFEK